MLVFRVQAMWRQQQQHLQQLGPQTQTAGALSSQLPLLQAFLQCTKIQQQLQQQCKLLSSLLLHQSQQLSGRQVGLMMQMGQRMRRLVGPLHTTTRSRHHRRQQQQQQMTIPACLLVPLAWKQLHQPALVVQHTPTLHFLVVLMVLLHQCTARHL